MTKYRVYIQERHYKTREQRWVYQGSTTRYDSKEEVEQSFRFFYDMSKYAKIRVEDARFFGYYIED